MAENSHLVWKDHSTILVSNLQNMLERNAFADLTLSSDEGHSIQVHRVIVCAASSYFEDLLSQHPSDTFVTIIMSNVSFEHLRALVEFTYQGKVIVPSSQLPSLLESASHLKIEGLVDAIKYHQRQHELLEKQDEGDKALFKIVSVKSIAQMSSQSDEPMSSQDNDLFVKEEANYDSDATVIYEPEENNWMCESGATGSALNELRRPVSLSYAPTSESPGMEYDRSSCKRKKNQLNSSTGTNISTHPTPSKRKSLLKDEEGSFEMRNLNAVASNIPGKEPLAADFTVLAGDETPPAPILFKRDPSMTEEGKEQGEDSHQDDDMLRVELVESDFDEDSESHEEENSTDSTDEDYATVPTSSKLKPTAHSITEKKRKALPKPQNTVSNGTFNCDACGRVYKIKRYLNDHVKYECGKEPLSCTLCNHRTARKSDLKKHLVRVHKMNDLQLASHGLGPKIHPEMPFKCDQCQRSYKLKGGLSRHSKDECGVYPRFQCTLCDHRAKRKNHYRDHLTSVHGISPANFAAHGVGYAFQCNICLYCCGRKVSLQKHMTTEHAA